MFDDFVPMRLGLVHFCELKDELEHHLLFTPVFGLYVH